MSLFQRMLIWFDDRLNPIVVKELRQAVQGRLLTWVLLALLFVQLVILGSYLFFSVASFHQTMSLQSGRSYFLSLHFILLMTGMMFVPLYTGIRMWIERTGQNADLLYITTLSPFSIISGKLQSAVVLTILIISACTPFMTVSYLLRGIDILSIFTVIGLSFFGILGGIQLAILMACLPVARFFKFFLGLVLLGMLFSFFAASFTMSEQIVRRGLSFYTSGTDSWITISLVGFAYIASLALLFSLSVALTSSASSNRLFPVRVILSSIWLASAVLCCSLCIYLKSYEPLLAWSILVSSFLSIILVFTIGERESFGVRVARTIPNNRVLRVLSYPFYTGSLHGMAWVLLFALATFSLLGLSYALFGAQWTYVRRFESSCMIPIVIFLFSFCYSVSGFFLRRLLFPKLRTEFSTIFSFVVFLISLLVPMLIYILLGWTQKERFLFFTPMLLGMESYRFHSLYVALGWSCLLFVFVLPLLFRSFSNFLPVAQESLDESKVSKVSG